MNKNKRVEIKITSEEFAAMKELADTYTRGNVTALIVLLVSEKIKKVKK